MTKKMFFVEWRDSWDILHSSLVRAKDKAHAWAKIRIRHPFSTRRLIDITEWI